MRKFRTSITSELVRSLVWGFVHHVTFAGDLEHKLVVGLLLGMANLLDQCDNIAPFEIMRRR